MDAQIGNFKVQLRKNGLLLRHSMGVGFEMTGQEALCFLQLLQAYQQTWIEQSDSTDPQTQPLIRFTRLDDDQPDGPQ